MGLLVDIKSRNVRKEEIEMKKSKITKEEWDRDKQNLTDDILNKYNIYDFMNCLVEFELPEFDLSYKTKEEDCGVPI